ncbi:glycosyltransferase [Metabacillus sp. GX 13764]|uniref:glycosyltransferase family 2 protein n=1 Tax=Metabacillus kandeliae TaxID=2900151 RepID=UPI001E419A24|nr:glycosyltransferase family 2 protein [Metabacillus kandeliae]MCD7033476.1 glycosyltransferase [Metabacillus kandeliae]
MKENESMLAASIVMPAYNKYELLRFSLYALHLQNYPKEHFEVLIIDDCSEDLTPLIDAQWREKLPNLRYFRLEKNSGRSFARNLGISMAKGEVIVFIDAEMLPEPDFLSAHMAHHAGCRKCAVSGGLYNRHVFTHYYQGFLQKQKEKLKELSAQTFYQERFLQALQGAEEAVPLVTEAEIACGKYKSLSYENTYFFNKGIRHFESNFGAFKLSYLAFLSGNVSVRKEHLIASGGFDEAFEGYGPEDWELGYRLTQDGVVLLIDEAAAACHQEHPISKTVFREAMANQCRLMEKHPVLDLLVLGLEYKGFDFQFMHSVLVEADHVKAVFDDVLQLISEMLQSLFVSLRDQVPEKKWRKILKERGYDLEGRKEALRKSGCPHLLLALAALAN